MKKWVLASRVVMWSFNHNEMIVKMKLLGRVWNCLMNGMVWNCLGIGFDWKYLSSRVRLNWRVNLAVITMHGYMHRQRLKILGFAG